VERVLLATSRITCQHQAESKTRHETLQLRYLEPGEHSQWDSLVESSPQGSIFCRSWWLKAVGEARVLGYFGGDEVQAGIPLIFEKRFGIEVCAMPRLTQTWGVVIRPSEGKGVTTAARENNILKAFAGRLSEIELFFHSFHPSLLNWLPFQWAGFRQTTRFTYLIEDLSDQFRVWNDMADNTRRQIRRAEKSGISVVPCRIEDVYRCEFQSYLRQNRKPPHTEAFLKRLYSATEENGCGTCFAAIDEHENIHSAGFLVWDRKRAYLLVRGSEEQFRSSGASSLLVWHAIQFAATRSRSFDFVGSIVENIERFNRDFGAKQTPYNYLTKLPPLVQCGLQIIGKL
jgi:Acetyltransferase (GNAT) domain